MKTPHRPHNTWRALLPSELLLCAIVTAVSLVGTAICLYGIHLFHLANRPPTGWFVITAFLWLVAAGTYAITAWVAHRAMLFDRDPALAVLSARQKRWARRFLRYFIGLDPKARRRRKRRP